MLLSEERERWLVEMQRERGRRNARKRLTDLLCSGHTMREALEACAKENVSLGIHAREIAEEERGYSEEGR